MQKAQWEKCGDRHRVKQDVRIKFLDRRGYVLVNGAECSSDWRDHSCHLSFFLFCQHDFVICVAFAFLIPSLCVSSTLSPPAFSCEAGEFLEMSAQECTQCAAGSYSLGSGIRFDQWDSMPAGFSSLATSLENSPREDDRLTCNRYVL